MKSRAFRSTAALLCILLFAGTPALGGPVIVSEVIQVLGVNPRSPVSLRLQNTHQNSDAVANGVSRARIGSVDISQGLDAPVDISENPGTLLSGLSVLQGPNVGIDIVDQDEVDGTICDCGEILIAGAGFPKWPFIFLAAVPLIFIPRGNPETPTPTPTPPGQPPPQHTPEPATLLLLGSGLAAIGAGLRRRRAKGQIESHGETKEG
jgi:hypothetical protein